MRNVTKVSLVSGQFWGYTIPLLWGRAWRYLAAALLFDLLGGFVRDNVQARRRRTGPGLARPPAGPGCRFAPEKGVCRGNRGPGHNALTRTRRPREAPPLQPCILVRPEESQAERPGGGVGGWGGLEQWRGFRSPILSLGPRRRRPGRAASARRALWGSGRPAPGDPGGARRDRRPGPLAGLLRGGGPGPDGGAARRRDRRRAGAAVQPALPPRRGLQRLGPWRESEGERGGGGLTDR